MKNLGIPLLAFALAAIPARAAVTLLDAKDWKVQFSGFAELDMIYDSTRSLTEVPGNNPIDKRTTANGAKGRTQFSPRNSRFNFTVLPPVYEGWTTQGVLEFDLLGFDPAPGSAAGNSEGGFFTNPTVRLRHGYLKATSEGNFSVIAGQYWTLFGWQAQYVPTTVSVPPVSGILYARTPQVTFLQTSKSHDGDTTVFGISFARPVQRESHVPNIDGGLQFNFGKGKGTYATPSGDPKDLPTSIGLSSTFRDIAVPEPGRIDTSLHYPGWAGAFDMMIPLIAVHDPHEWHDGHDGHEHHESGSLTMTGELSIGRAYGDLFPGWSGNLPQLLTTATAPNLPNLDAGLGGPTPTGFRLVNLRSWNMSFQYHLPKSDHTFFTLGYAQLFSSNIEIFTPSAGRAAYERAETAWLNVFHDFTPQVRAAMEYAYFQTIYADNATAQNHRFQVSAWFRI